MSPAQARRKLRSLLYRSRLAEGLPEIEAELITFLQTQGPQVIDGVRVAVHHGRLVIERVQEAAGEQLCLFPEQGDSYATPI